MIITIFLTKYTNKWLQIITKNISSQGNDIKLLKQLPFYEKTIKPRAKEFTDAKLLSELPFFEKPTKAKIKQLSIKKLLSQQLCYKQPINNHTLKD